MTFGRKLKHANSILETFKYFFQMSSKSIYNFELYRFRVGAFLRPSVYSSGYRTGYGCK